MTLRQWTEESYLPSIYYNMTVLFHISTNCVSVILSSFILIFFFFSFLINLQNMLYLWRTENHI